MGFSNKSDENTAMRNKRYYHIMKITVSWLFVILCAGIIFFLSSQTAVESSVHSRGMADSFISILGITTDDEAVILTYEGIIRETAHGIEYLVLAFLLCNALYVSGCSKYMIFGIFICVLYGISDEIHQIPIPGRAFEIKDIVIDATGSIVGSTIYWLIMSWFKKKQLKYRLKDVEYSELI